MIVIDVLRKQLLLLHPGDEIVKNFYKCKLCTILYKHFTSNNRADFYGKKIVQYL
jgi:hypothetical protein